jgi:hypothetical protein
MPILGIIASQNYPRATNSYESIATAAVSSNSASVTISSIPAGYKHLQIRASMVTSSPNNDLAMRFNSDTGNNYYRHIMYGDGSSATSFSGINANFISASFSQPSTHPGVFIMDVLDYADSNKYKTVRSLWGYCNPGNATYLGLSSATWASTSAVTSITLFNTLTASTINQYSSIAVYGIK